MLQQNDLKIIEKHPDHYILIHRSSARKLVYKECDLSNSILLQKTPILQELKKRNNIDHQNLLKLFSFNNETHNSEPKKIAIIYEHSAKSFSHELNLRLQTQIHWTEQELINTLEVLLYGLDFLHCNGLVHGNITKNSMVYSHDGFVKLADQFIQFNGYKRTIEQIKTERNNYISPEALLNENDDAFPMKENDIWQLGMIFLESSLLKSCLDLIDWQEKTIDFEEMNQRIEEIEKLKSKNLAKLLRIMLNVLPEKRLEIMKVLKEKWPENLADDRDVCYEKQMKKGVLKNSHAINICLKPQFEENCIKEKALSERGMNKSSNENLIVNKENSVVIKENGDKSKKFQEILQMLENYKSPFQNNDSNNSSRLQSRKKSDSINNTNTNIIKTSQLLKEPQTFTSAQMILNKQYLNLEGIIEETEENQEDKENQEHKEEKENQEKNIKNQEKNEITCFKAKHKENLQTNDKLAELQSLFEKSRARTNEILAKGKLIVPIAKIPQEIAYELLASTIDKIDKKNQLSIVLYKNQDKYEGDLSKSEQREGFGVYYKANGQILYQGEWHNNFFQGAGILNNTDVEFSQENLDYNDLSGIKNLWLKYEGEFSLGKKQGNGVLLFSNKEHFQGCFKNDKVHGFGCFHRKNGLMIFAEWKDSKLVRLL